MLQKNIFRLTRLCFLVALTVSAFWPGCSAAISTGTPAPEIAAENWLNSKPLTIGDLRGRVVLVEFWTYG
ncbi:MAG TPA: hypothetical protein VH985_18285 [Candidatus Binatia bacterium]